MTQEKLETQFVRHDDLVVAIDVTQFIDSANPWSPVYSPADVDRLVFAKRALRAGDLAEAAKYGKVYRLTPVDPSHRQAS